MTDFAVLAMRVDATGMAPGEQALDSITAKGALAEARVTQATTRISKGMGEVGSGAKRMGPAIQNASYQVGDFAVQIAGGGSAVTAFAQQMPQLLGGLGVFGALAGAAVAIGGALIPMLFDGAAGAEEMAKEVEDLNDRLTSYLKIADMAHASTADMHQQFGDIAGAAREVLAALLEIERIQFMQDMSHTAETISNQLDGLRGALTRYQGAMVSSTALGEDRTLAMQIAVNDLNAEFGLTVQQAEAVSLALEGLGAARDKGPRAAADAAKDLGDALMVAYEAGGRTNEELIAAAKEAYQFQLTAAEAAQVMGDVGDATVSAVDASEDWAAAMANVNAQLSGAYALLSSIGGGMVQRAGIEAANAVLDAGGTALSAEQARRRAEERARIIQQASTAEGFMPAADLDALLAEQERQWAAEDEYMNRLNAVREGEREAARAGRGGGRSGRSEAERKREERRREGDQIRDMIRSPLEVWQDEQKNLNALLEVGYLSTEEHAKAMEHFAQQYDPLIAATEQWRDTMKDTFMGIVSGSMSVKEALGNIIGKFAEMAAMQAFDMLWSGNATGKGSGGILGSFVNGLLSLDGGGYTGDGARSGGVDGKGGFLAVMHPRETVIDHTKGQAAGGGHMSIGFDASIGSLTATMHDIAGNVVARESSAIVGQSVSAVQRGTRKTSRFLGA